METDAGLIRPNKDEMDGLVMVCLRKGGPPTQEGRLLADIGESLGARVTQRDVGEAQDFADNAAMLFLNGARIGFIESASMAEAIKRNSYAPFRKRKQPAQAAAIGRGNGREAQRRVPRLH